MINQTSERFTLESFTAGKQPERNEDAFGYNADTIVLSDGATDKAGILYDHNTRTGAYKTGGEIAAGLVVQTALKSNLNGEALVSTVSATIDQYYAKHTPAARQDSAYRFAATMLVARIVDNELIITQIGDTAFRLNGQREYKNDKEIDTINAKRRSEYIKSTGDIQGGREHILPQLRKQHELQNARHQHGYGVLDGSPVPAQFIRTFTFPMSEVTTLELVTDGYFGAFPTDLTIEAYENYATT